MGSLTMSFTVKFVCVYTKEIENMDTKIKDLIDSLDLTQETRNEIKLQNQKKIKNDEEKNVREWN